MERMLVAVVGLSLLSSCGQGERPTRPEGATQVDHLATSRTDLYSNENCPVERQAYTAPAPDRKFVFRVMPGTAPEGLTIFIEETILRSQGDRVFYSEVMRSESMPDVPGHEGSLRQGFIPVSAPGLSFGFLPAERTPADLSPGESLTLQATEVSEQGSEPSERPVTFKISLVSCGRTTDAVPGAPNEPVRIYRIEIPNPAIAQASSGFGAVELEVLVSPRLGWRVAQASNSASMVLVAQD